MSRGVARLFPHPRSRSDAILDALHAALLGAVVVYVPAYLATIHGMPSVFAMRDRRFRATRGPRSLGRRRRACIPKVWKLHVWVHPASVRARPSARPVGVVEPREQGSPEGVLQQSDDDLPRRRVGMLDGARQ